jgi:hypothetical protein
MELAKVNLQILATRVNSRIGSRHDAPYMSRVRAGSCGSAALREIVRQEEEKMLREEADAKATETQTPNHTVIPG